MAKCSHCGRDHRAERGLDSPWVEGFITEIDNTYQRWVLENPSYSNGEWVDAMMVTIEVFAKTMLKDLPLDVQTSVAEHLLDIVNNTVEDALVEGITNKLGLHPED